LLRGVGAGLMLYPPFLIYGVAAVSAGTIATQGTEVFQKFSRERTMKKAEGELQ